MHFSFVLRVHFIHPITLLCYADKRICQYNESVHPKEQLATRISTIP